MEATLKKAHGSLFDQDCSKLIFICFTIVALTGSSMSICQVFKCLFGFTEWKNT